VFDSDKNKGKIYTLNVKATEENIFEIPKDDHGKPLKLHWFSIDPHLKVLIEIKSVSAPIEMFIRQLQYGITVNEKIQAIRVLRLLPSEDENTKSAAINTLKNIVLDDEIFWGISSLAATKLGELQMDDDSYNSLKECFNHDVQNPFIRRALVSAVGKYIPQKPDAFDLLKPTIENGDKSYFVEIEALMAIAKAKDGYSLRKLMEAAGQSSIILKLINVLRNL
jgi:hypothetical protein